MLVGVLSGYICNPEDTKSYLGIPYYCIPLLVEIQQGLSGIVCVHCPLNAMVRLIEVRREEQGMKFFMKVHYDSFFGSSTMAVSVVGFGVLCLAHLF